MWFFVCLFWLGWRCLASNLEQYSHFSLLRAGITGMCHTFSFHLVFWGSLTSTRYLPISLSRLGKEPQGPICLPLPSTGITNASHLACLCMWVLGIKLTLAGQALCQLSCTPMPPPHSCSFFLRQISCKLCLSSTHYVTEGELDLLPLLPHLQSAGITNGTTLPAVEDLWVWGQKGCIVSLLSHKI